MVNILHLLRKTRKKLAKIKPLVMLSCDFKIFAKIIANRLQLVIPQLINDDQKGFIKGRNIGDNLLELETLLKERVTPVKRVTVGPPPVFTFYIISTFYLRAPWLLVSTMYLLCFNAYYLQVAVQSL